jgi:bifunctional DNA-binding transcriptional regulator/antitoxin component of YhaV-PrlF toxin-antitoxin module
VTTLTLTAKRQATFPRETCEALGLRPGDRIELEPREEAGEKVWVLRPRPSRSREWVGCLRASARAVEDHSMAAVRRSIASGRKAQP